MSKTDVEDKPENAIEPGDFEFQEQKEAFNRIPPSALVEYRGRFIASRNGEIVDSDSNLAALTRRFFREHGDVAVFVTRVGEPIQVTIATPFLK